MIEAILMLASFPGHTVGEVTLQEGGGGGGGGAGDEATLMPVFLLF